jgi:hypothetical protein
MMGKLAVSTFTKEFGMFQGRNSVILFKLFLFFLINSEPILFKYLLRMFQIKIFVHTVSVNLREVTLAIGELALKF